MSDRKRTRSGGLPSFLLDPASGAPASARRLLAMYSPAPEFTQSTNRRQQDYSGAPTLARLAFLSLKAHASKLPPLHVLIPSVPVDILFHLLSSASASSLFKIAAVSKLDAGSEGAQLLDALFGRKVLLDSKVDRSDLYATWAAMYVGIEEEKERKREKTKLAAAGIARRAAASSSPRHSASVMSIAQSTKRASANSRAVSINTRTLTPLERVRNQVRGSTAFAARQALRKGKR